MQQIEQENPKHQTLTHNPKAIKIIALNNSNTTSNNFKKNEAPMNQQDKAQDKTQAALTTSTITCAIQKVTQNTKINKATNEKSST